MVGSGAGVVVVARIGVVGVDTDTGRDIAAIRGAGLAVITHGVIDGGTHFLTLAIHTVGCLRGTRGLIRSAAHTDVGMDATRGRITRIRGAGIAVITI